MSQLEQAKLEVIEYANRMLTEGLVKGTSGNVSVRVGDQVAITPGSVPAVHYMIHAFGGDTIEVSDYERFGSDELAAAVHSALGDRRGVLLRNHGAVVHGPDLGRAYDLAVLLEWLAELYWRSSVFGEPRILSHDQLEEVATEAARQAYAGAGGGDSGSDS